MYGCRLLLCRSRPGLIVDTMIERLKIEGFKSIEKQEFTFAPLTIVTGLNSTGKSSLLQAIAYIVRYSSDTTGKLLSDIVSPFEVVRNKYQNSEQVRIRLTKDEEDLSLKISREFSSYFGRDKWLDYERNIYYLTANRIGPENLVTIFEDKVCGLNGEALFGTYDNEKSEALREALIMDDVSFTLESQVNYWLRYILDLPVEISSERVNTQTAQIFYKSDGIPNIQPRQLGAGVSYLAKILILCLRAKEGDVVMIENPEIHLHPAAQSRLAEFLAFMIKSGVQLIVETHCENVLNRLRYEVFSENLRPEDIVIFYKQEITTPFLRIGVKSNGQYDREFPEGFFDATLDALVQID